MPLSEHEQRMLEQIESALYADDPKFASNVNRRRLGGASARRRLQALVIFLVGLVLLIGGLIIGVTIAGFPIVSFIGFVVMFGAGLFALWGSHGAAGVQPSDGAQTGEHDTRRGDRGSRPGLSQRMEERFNRRFDHDQE